MPFHARSARAHRRARNDPRDRAPAGTRTVRPASRSGLAAHSPPARNGALRGCACCTASARFTQAGETCCCGMPRRCRDAGGAVSRHRQQVQQQAPALLGGRYSVRRTGLAFSENRRGRRVRRGNVPLSLRKQEHCRRTRGATNKTAIRSLRRKRQRSQGTRALKAEETAAKWTSGAGRRRRARGAPSNDSKQTAGGESGGRGKAKGGIRNGPAMKRGPAGVTVLRDQGRAKASARKEACGEAL
ncbi:hypothetical protein ERJ75_000455300 [Trypanosoma vivax]|nr:hypothetical protein ERJ75_000455300 [Trypanosoma vivax]